MDDAQILKTAHEYQMEEADFAKTLDESFQDEIEDEHFPNTLEIHDAPFSGHLGNPGLDGINHCVIESTEAAEGQDKLHFEPYKDPSSELIGVWKSPRPRSVDRKRLRESDFMDDKSFMASESNKVHNFSVNETESPRFSTPMWNEPEPCPVGAGLANMGNTCFLNAILQCFTHTVPLVQGLLSLKHEPSNHAGEFCVLCAVRCQIELSLWHSERVIAPSNLVDNLSYISSFFRRYQQEDAHEFLQCLSDKLDTNWSNYEGNEKDSSSSNDSLVKQIFGGRIVSQVRCCKCGHNSNTYESLIDLSLEIEDADNLESALKSFTKVESIEDTEKFICGGCKEQVPVEKQLMLDQTPSVAALHLKRFKSDGIYIEKNNKKVDYPLELDLKPYTKYAEEDGNKEAKYELFGVVVHVGVSSTSGHYFCYIRTAPDTWYRFDDSKVSRVLEATALSEDAYILFYAKKGTEYFSSFFDKWKAMVSEQKSPATSPKSVLHRMDLHDCEAATNKDAAQAASPETDRVETASLADSDNHNSCTRTSRTYAPSTSGHFDYDEAKIDGPDSDSQFSLETKINGEIETCSSSPYSYVEKTAEIEPCTPPRSPSPDIYYDEEPAEARYLVPVGHLKVEDKTTSAKNIMEKVKNDMKRKEAVRYMSKSMASGRRDMLMAAMLSPPQDKTDKKRRKPIADERERLSPKKNADKRVLRPVVA